MTDRDLAVSVRRLEPEVRNLEPVVRLLRTDEHEGDRTIVTISSDVLFEFDSATLTPGAARVAADVANEIAGTEGAIGVVGHTDAIGTDDYNRALSERRAASVADALRAVLGPGRQVTTQGRGESEPVAPNELQGQDNPHGRALNRRVVISFTAAT